MIVLLLALIFSLGIALISYYKIFLPVRGKIVVFLFILRTLAVFMTFLLISEPILTFILKSNQPPTVAFLFDNSKSMGIKDRLGDRGKTVKSIMDEISKFEMQGEKKFFTFAGDIEEKKNLTPDSLTFSGGLTDISKALGKVHEISKRENIKSIVLVSDGVYNSGENPIYFSEKFNIPIFTIGVGDSSVQKDLKIIDVLTNEVTYAGNETPVLVRIESAGFSEGKANVYLYDEGKEVGEEKVDLKAGVNEYTVSFKFIPREEGMRKLTVKVQQLPGEITYENNQKSIYVKVLKGKYKILIVSSAPSPDLAFIKRVLVENKSYDVISYTEKKGGEFIEGNFDAKIAETSDAIFFIGYPVKTSDIEILNKLKSIITSLNKPVFFLISRNIDFVKLKAFADILPFRFSNVSGDEDIVNLSITEDGRNHLVTDLKDRNYIWNILPPVFKLRGVFAAAPGSVVLAKAKYQNVETNEPLIIADHLGNRKTVVILCYGIWRWKLLTAPNKEFEGFFETFINNVARWLIAPAEEEFIKFKIAKNFYSEDEAVEFSAQVYSQDYSPISDADVRIKILNQSSGELVNEFNLEQVGFGLYSGSINLSRGDYRYEAVVSRRGMDLKNFSGRFTVGESEVEFLNTRMDVKLLREIAQKTGGEFLTPDEIDNLPKIISSLPDFKPAVVERRREYILWSRIEPLLIVVILLSIEWFLRKRYGLA
jgi:hypothetical protein